MRERPRERRVEALLSGLKEERETHGEGCGREREAQREGCGIERPRRRGIDLADGEFFGFELGL